MKQIVILCFGLILACGGEPPAPPVALDSAGVSIVQNFGPTWSREEAWRVAPIARIDIGGSTTDPNYQLTRIVGSTQLDDGSIVVAVGGTQELRWYDANGNWRHSAGGTVTFASIEWIGRLGAQAVMVFDFGNLRLSVYDSEGQIQQSRTLVVTFQASPSSAKGVFNDSSVLAVRDVKSWAPTMIRAGSTPEGLVRGPAAAFRYGADGAFLNSVGSFQGAQRIFSTGQGRFVRVTPPPFGRTTVFAASNDRFYVGTQDEYELSVYDVQGGLTGILRLDRPNAPTTEQDIGRYKRGRLAGVHELQKADREAELDALPYPETMPAHGPIRVDGDGNLWVADPRPFGDERQVWNVFDSEHRMLGTVELLRDLVVHEFGSDYVLGSMTGEDRIQHLQLYELEKPEERGDS